MKKKLDILAINKISIHNKVVSTTDRLYPSNKSEQNLMQPVRVSFCKNTRANTANTRDITTQPRTQPIHPPFKCDLK